MSFCSSRYLAKLYNSLIKRINDVFNNNPRKFPKRYAFRVEENDFAFLKSNFSTSKCGFRKGQMIFTKQGVAIIKSDISIKIIETFVKMRIIFI